MNQKRAVKFAAIILQCIAWGLSLYAAQINELKNFVPTIEYYIILALAIGFPLITLPLSHFVVLGSPKEGGYFLLLIIKVLQIIFLFSYLANFQLPSIVWLLWTSLVIYLCLDIGLIFLLWTLNKKTNS